MLQRCALLTLAATLLTGCAAPLTAGLDRAAPARQVGAGRVQVVGADSVIVLPCSEATFATLRALLDGARRRIDVEVYELGRGDMIDALIAAHRRGVKVTVIADESEDHTAASVLQLRAAGVTVVDYPLRKQMIDHVKLLVADSQVAAVGGINWGASTAANHDVDLEIRGPAVRNLERVFDRDLVTSGAMTVTVPDPAVDPGILVATTLPGAAILPVVLQVIGEARQTLDVEMYTLTDQPVVAALIAAHRRGVAVRVLLDPSERPSDPSAALLRQAGVPLRLYRSHGELLHAKTAVADSHAVIAGSANWTVSGFEHNHELDVELPDASGVAVTFTAQMQADWDSSA